MQLFQSACGREARLPAQGPIITDTCGITPDARTFLCNGTNRGHNCLSAPRRCFKWSFDIAPRTPETHRHSQRETPLLLVCEPHPNHSNQWPSVQARESVDCWLEWRTQKLCDVLLQFKMYLQGRQLQELSQEPGHVAEVKQMNWVSN